MSGKDSDSSCRWGGSLEDDHSGLGLEGPLGGSGRSGTHTALWAPGTGTLGSRLPGAGLLGVV